MMDFQLNTIRALGAAAAITVAMVPGAASANIATGTLPVTANVTSNCSVSTAAVAFGATNVVSGANTDATGSVSVTCTNGTAWSAAGGLGAGTGATFASRKMTSGSDLLNYTLYIDSARTSVWGDGSGTTSTVSNTGNGAVQSFTVYGRVPSGQSSVPVGSYSDSVTVTITY